MARKLLYYWTLLHKSESELCKQVFNAQQEFPTEGRWTSEVQGVLKSCNITYTSDQISKITNTKIQSKVLLYLVTLQNKHTKSEKLHLENKMQPYLRTNELSIREKNFLFILRSKMLKLKANFPSMYGNNLVCSLCTEVVTVESESHLLNCSILMENTAVAEEMKQVKHEDVFSDTKK